MAVESPPEAPAPIAPVQSAVPQDLDLADFWHDTVMALVKAEAIGALVRELALQSCLVSRDSGQWRLCVPNTSLAQTGSRDRLQAALQAAGHDVKLTLETGPVADSPAKRLAAAAAARQRRAEETMLQDPFVLAMMRDFGGKIVPGSIQPL